MPLGLIQFAVECVGHILAAWLAVRCHPPVSPHCGLIALQRKHGGANAVIGMLWPLIEQNFQVKERRLRTAVDFNATAPSVSIFAQATLTLGQAITLGLRLTIRFLKLFMEYRTETKQTEKQTSSTQKEAV